MAQPASLGITSQGSLTVPIRALHSGAFIKTMLLRRRQLRKVLAGHGDVLRVCHLHRTWVLLDVIDAHLLLASTDTRVLRLRRCRQKSPIRSMERIRSAARVDARHLLFGVFPFSETSAWEAHQRLAPA